MRRIGVLPRVALSLRLRAAQRDFCSSEALNRTRRAGDPREDCDNLPGVIDFVNHAVIAYSDAPSLATRELTTTERPRIVSERGNSVTDPLISCGGQPGQLLLRAPRKADAVRH